MERVNYLMNAYDVAMELGVSKGRAYKVIRKLNAELEASGYIVVSGRVPRAYWEKKFYGYETKMKELKKGAN